MMTRIEYDTEINFPDSVAPHKRRILTRRHNIEQARRILIKDGADEGQVWNLVAEITCVQNKNIIENYIDKFSLII